MPLYTYVCSERHRFDLLRSMSKREQPATCPECGQPAKPDFTVCTWNYTSRAGAHGMFIQETRKGHSAMTANADGITGTREELIAR